MAVTVMTAEFGTIHYYSSQGRVGKISTFLIFLKKRSFILSYFPQTLLISFLVLALRVGDSLTREGLGYATDSSLLEHSEAWLCSSSETY